MTKLLTTPGYLVPLIGAQFTNNTGGTITSLAISSIGEQWRLGQNTTGWAADRIDFQLSTNATGIGDNAANWTDYDSLDFSSPVTTGTVGALNGNVAPNRTNLSFTVTGLSLPNGATFWIRWLDSDLIPGSDDGLAVDDFSLTPNGVIGDNAPFVSSTTPANGATGVALNANLTVNFSEPVNVSGAWFNITCTTSGAHTATVSGGPSSFTLNPDANFVYSESCTATIYASQVTDQDATDPPDNMNADFSWSFSTTAPPPPSPMIINEVDSDTPGTDTLEFVELYDGGLGNTDLSGLVLVFYNGNDDMSYAMFDLDGSTTDAAGYFTLGNSAVTPAPNIVFNNGLLQNGPDAVALYRGNATDFPNGTPVTTFDLIDALVYDTADADDAGLLPLLNTGEPQIDEAGAGNAEGHSNQRCPNGADGQRNTNTYLDFVNAIVTAGPNADVVVLGDLNDFQFSDTVTLLKGTLLNTLMDTLPLSEQYSYDFDGNSQAIDHTLLSNHLFTKRPYDYDVVHVNSEFADQASDHEPQVAHITLNDPPTVDAGGPYEVVEGGSVMVSATGNDPENGPLSYAWDLDNNGTFETPGQSATFSAATLSAPSSHRANFTFTK